MKLGDFLFVAIPDFDELMNLVWMIHVMYSELVVFSSFDLLLSTDSVSSLSSVVHVVRLIPLRISVLDIPLGIAIPVWGTLIVPVLPPPVLSELSLILSLVFGLLLDFLCFRRMLSPPFSRCIRSVLSSCPSLFVIGVSTAIVSLQMSSHSILSLEVLPISNIFSDDCLVSIGDPCIVVSCIVVTFVELLLDLCLVVDSVLRSVSSLFSVSLLFPSRSI